MNYRAPAQDKHATANICRGQVAIVMGSGKVIGDDTCKQVRLIREEIDPDGMWRHGFQ